MATPAPPANYASLTTAQQDAWWESYFKTLKGTVSATWVKSNADLKPYQGETALAMYEKLAKVYPSASPQQRGSTVYQVWLGAGLTQAIGTAVGAGGTALGDTAKGVETATILPSWTDSLTNLLGDLTSANTWIRVAKVLGGGIILFIGVAKLTGADAKIGGIVAKATKAAPLL